MARPPKATLDSVLSAMDELERRGERVIAENVQRITGGSMSTVSPLFRQAKDVREAAAGPRANGLGPSFTAAAYSEINRHVDFALTAQRDALESARSEADALAEEAKTALDRVESLETELAEARSLAENQRIEADKQLAAAGERTAAGEERLRQVEGERDNAIRAAEMSRTEAAKAQMNVERADKAAAQAVERVAVLERQIESLRQERAEALQRAAVAEERATGAEAARADAREQIAALQRQVEAAMAENKSLSARLLDLQVAKGEAEQRAALAEARLESVGNPPEPPAPDGKKSSPPPPKKHTIGGQKGWRSHQFDGDDPDPK
jgi:myosin heavy subunit